MSSNPFRQTRFLMSVDRPEDLPSDTGAEVAIIGRSNVGKSSLLNAICDQKSLARVSRTPGRTQQIVVFEVAPQQRMLDLPGFGYAAVSRDLRDKWNENLPRLLERRQALRAVILVADARLPLRAEEQQLLTWCASVGMPCALALNKADKLGNAAAQAARLAVIRVTDALPSLQIHLVLSSALQRQGVDQLRKQLRAFLTSSKG
jgi:GTP-binding protein